MICHFLEYKDIACKSEAVNLHGRCDLEVLFKRQRYVFEFKLARQGQSIEHLLDEACAQAKERHYGEVVPLYRTYRYAVVLSAPEKKIARFELIDVLNDSEDALN